jgi:hypothetical protein
VRGRERRPAPTSVSASPWIRSRHTRSAARPAFPRSSFRATRPARAGAATRAIRARIRSTCRGGARASRPPPRSTRGWCSSGSLAPGREPTGAAASRSAGPHGSRFSTSSPRRLAASAATSALPTAANSMNTRRESARSSVSCRGSTTCRWRACPISTCPRGRRPHTASTCG